MTTPPIKISFKYDIEKLYPINFPVPNGYNFVTINIVGGSGGGGDNGNGGNGCKIQTFYNIPTTVTSFKVIVGAGGINSSSSSRGGGGGGQYSQVVSNDRTIIVISGGGGGGGAGNFFGLSNGSNAVISGNSTSGNSNSVTMGMSDTNGGNNGLGDSSFTRNKGGNGNGINYPALGSGFGAGNGGNNDDLRGRGGAGGDGTNFGGPNFSGGKGASIGDSTRKGENGKDASSGDGGDCAKLNGRGIFIGGNGGLNASGKYGGGGGGAGFGGGGGGAGGSAGYGGGGGGSYISSNAINSSYISGSDLFKINSSTLDEYGTGNGVNGYILFEFINVPSNTTPICYNIGTKILSLENIENKEIYKPIEELRNGDLIKTYLHGYRRITHIGKQQMLNNPLDWKTCMYKMKKTETNGLIEDLVVTGRHSILVDDYSNCTNSRWLSTLPLYNYFSKLFINTLNKGNQIDDKYLLAAADANAFEPLQDRKIYTYYHLVLESEGEEDRRYGIWANGILSETTYQKDYIECHFEEL